MNWYLGAAIVLLEKEVEALDTACKCGDGGDICTACQKSGRLSEAIKSLREEMEN